MPKSIEFIYFDLGNVILHFDPEIGCQNIAQLTGLDSARIHSVIHETSLQTDYESGTVSSGKFVSRFAAASGTNPDPAQLLKATSNMFTFNRSMIPVLTQLQNCGFPIGILSNTCPAHWEFLTGRFPAIERIFRKPYCVLSFESGSMKPDERIYRDAIQAAGCPPERIFFIDDRLENVTAARKHSIRAELFESVEKLLRDLDKNKIRINL